MLDLVHRRPRLGHRHHDNNGRDWPDGVQRSAAVSADGSLFVPAEAPKDRDGNGLGSRMALRAGPMEGVLGIENKLLFDAEIGFVGLTVNLLFAVALWLWWNRRNLVTADEVPGSQR